MTMIDAHNLTASIGLSHALYRALLPLYPEPYRQQFGEEMVLVFCDSCQDELAAHGHIRLSFWFSALKDIGQSVFEEHVDSMRQQGIRDYLSHTLQINRYHIISAILLLPITLLVALDAVVRIIQGSLFTPNAAVGSGVSRAVTSSGQAQLIWVLLVYSPIAAMLVTLFPVVRSWFVRTPEESAQRRLNLVTLGIIGLGLFFVALAFGHDVFPCFVRELLANGLSNFQGTFTMCINTP